MVLYCIVLYHIISHHLTHGILSIFQRAGRLAHGALSPPPPPLATAQHSTAAQVLCAFCSGYQMRNRTRMSERASCRVVLDSIICDAHRMCVTLCALELSNKRPHVAS